MDEPAFPVSPQDATGQSLWWARYALDRVVQDESLPRGLVGMLTTARTGLEGAEKLFPETAA